MARLRFRSTSLVDLQAELHEADLLRDVGRTRVDSRPRPRRRAVRFGLRLIGRRTPG